MSVTLRGVSITHIKTQSGQAYYRGIVTFHIQSNGIEFEYQHDFDSVNDIVTAIANGSAFLKHELDQLSSEAQNVPRNL